MKKILIIGAGGLAREIRWLIEEINEVNRQFEFIGYIVSDLNSLKDTDSKELVLGDFSWFDNLEEEIDVCIGIGNPKNRLAVGEILLKNKYLNFPNLFHPSVRFQKSTCSFGRGIIICANTLLTSNIQIDDFALINLSCVVGHESKIGKGSVINSVAKISGGVKIGMGVLVGTGATILQYRSIGNNSTVGAASCVTKSIPDKVIAFGLPAKIIRTEL